MRMIIMLVFVMGLINLTACSHFSGNVVPEKGPTMEEVYDSMETIDTMPKIVKSRAKNYSTLPLIATNNAFHKLPNPELKMYVFPHLAGKDEMPIPGYYTAFNAYTEDHYALPNETIRE